MKRLLPWKRMAVAGLGLIVVSAGARVPTCCGAPSHAAIRAAADRDPRTPYRMAMREAALSWMTAVQLADDQLAEARAVLQDWDPAAPFDERGTRRRLLRSDEGGYVRQALAAIRRAGRVARTPGERWRAEEEERRWESAIGPTGFSTAPHDFLTLRGYSEK
jgi:hypothetical protein